MKKKVTKSKQPRNWLAVSAKFRNSAGAMKSKHRREDNNKTSRDWLHEGEINDIHPEEITAYCSERMDPESFWGTTLWEDLEDYERKYWREYQENLKEKK